MELHAEDVVAFDDGGKRFRMRGGSHAGIGYRRRERVREVDVRARLEPGQEASATWEIERVPADLEHLEPLLRIPLQAGDASGFPARARHVGRLVASLEQPLHP